ncbi:glycoside hydrolase family 10 protein [Deinococcus sp. JMULE3]|uniref:glycoside hydrolase family 10 protein n=1 Tax=Deinococcus sp. JMULE3 TaxID=2518341 RepID=UPI00157692F2|nr:family 10 glycosylhydrolase [Deinococcus sp. JMULE3]NTY01379.1 glycoside hydrolase family 10 protein [Deinococcus sp. JMULE3]
MPRPPLRALLLPLLLGVSASTAQTATPAPATPTGSAATPPGTAQPAAAQPAATQPAAGQPGPNLPGASLRGLWIDAFGPGLKTPAQVRQTVQDAARLGVNTLFVQAIRRADCLCRKASVPAISDADLTPGFDPLDAITAQAHARGMRVIAWISVTGIANTTVPNTSPDHLMRAHGPDSGRASWLARRPDGSWLEGKDAWLDAAIPDAAEYVTQAAVSLVRHYPVDGIQLDRIRYPDGGAWGYDPKTLARYRAETGKSGTPAPTDAAWQAWKREQITNLVRRITLEVKAVRPDAWVSAATITYSDAPADPAAFRQTRTYTDVLQDWPTWMQTGLIDLNVLMNYKRDAAPPQGAWFDRWNAFAQQVQTRPDGQRVALASGTAMYLNAPQVTAAQAARSVRAGLGWVGYSYRTPTADVYGQRQTTPAGLGAVQAALTAPGAALHAPRPWTEAPPTTRGLLGRITGAGTPGGQTVQVLRGGQPIAQTQTDALGYYGFATLTPGPVEIRVSGQRWLDRVPERGVVRLPDLLVRAVQLIPSLPPARP